MKNYIKYLLPNYFKILTTNSAESVGFQLSHKDLIIGNLHFENNEWKFKYSDEFKSQFDILPIVDFPAKETIYISAYLWPYFASRIPSSNSPHIERKIKKNNLDETSLVEMLKAFGQSSISSPFRLTLL